MIGCGTTTSTDPDNYRLHVPGASLNLVLTGRGGFMARLTWLELRRLRVVRFDENISRIAFVTLAPRRVFITFPTRHEEIWNGVKLRLGDIVFHRLGERIHQRASEPSRWGLISITPEDLADVGSALLGTQLAPPPASKILRPLSKVATHLRRLHAKVCRLVEAKPHMIAHREVARALEQELTCALVNCLTADERCHDMGMRQAHTRVMAQFEDILASRFDAKQPSIRELAAAVGVSERILRRCCMEFLGMGPGEYSRLRRLNLARGALWRANGAIPMVPEIARQYGFSDLREFVAAYRAVFGEFPSATMRNLHPNLRPTVSVESA
jgi:AraC-like DNA-binding protein